MHTATYGPPCSRCGARTEHRHNEDGFNYQSQQTHLTGCPYYMVGPEGSIEKREREAREARRARYTVEILWRYAQASGTCVVTVEASGMEAAFSAALAHGGTNVVTEGGAGIVSFTVTYTPKADLTKEEEG